MLHFGSNKGTDNYVKHKQFKLSISLSLLLDGISPLLIASSLEFGMQHDEAREQWCSVYEGHIFFPRR